ncbi:MAG: NADAR family protein [Burkholderiaceae bacterium]|nr:NADAR family protein [Burkholderiaceae bacterium]
MDDKYHVEELRARFNSGERLKFVFFWGHQPATSGVTASCFSQWYGAPFEVAGERYPTAEHYMMAEKAVLFGDINIRRQILQAPNPGAAKALGRRVLGFDEGTWTKERFAIVCRANLAKFSQNRELGEFLAHTGRRVLVEASPVDRVWGIGLAQDDERANNPNLWRGLNLLGFALMHARACLAAA